MLAIEFLRHVIDDYVVQVFAAQPVIAIRREHLDSALANAHDRDVECAAAEVEHENGLVFIEFVEAVGDRRRGWLVDDLENVEPGELTSCDRRRAFRIVEISRHGDDNIGDLRLEIFFCVRFQLLQD